MRQRSDTRPSPRAALAWTTPDGWEEQAGQGMRLATFVAGGERGRVECSVVSLAGSAALAGEPAVELAEPDQALPTLIGVLLPVGLRGLVVAGLLAALMSSLSSVFNSCSTLITWDIYRKLHPKASERQLVHVGQIATVVV